MALVIVLSFVVLLTVAVVAYFSRVVAARQTANDSFNGAQTDGLARSALDVIVNDFKQEIANGSTAGPSPNPNGYPLTYYPTDRKYMVPVRNGAYDAMPNLVRRSVYQDPVAAPGVASRASQVNSAGDASVNGRLVSAARWNRHYLLPSNSSTTANDSTPAAADKFVPPDWVLVTRNGPAAQTAVGSGAGALNDATPSNGNYVVGRYAYAVYDEGGLLDANVAGFPSKATPAQIGAKGTLGHADVSQAFAAATPAVLFSQTLGLDKLVGWRNYTSAQPTGSFPGSTFALNFQTDPSAAARYFASLPTNTSGFVRTGNATWNGRTDQAFLSRQQLLSFQQSLQQASAGSFPAAALQYLGTFSRALNAPSWGPTQNASDLGGADLDINKRPCNYKTIRDQDTVAGTSPLQPVYNRLLPGVRYANGGTITSYRLDGTPFTYGVNAGDPLVQRRFSLGRLAWVGPNGPRTDKGATDAGILSCFGLKWDKTHNYWVYSAPGSQYIAPTTAYGDTSQIKYTIKSLGEVAKENPPREPNFFELLEAGMLSGSLAMSPQDRSQSGGANSAFNYSYDTSPESWPDLHVFRIGASILTQSQTLDPTATQKYYYPVVIDYARNTVDIQAAGIDDLPYLTMYHMLAGKNPTASSVECFMIFGLWNPNQNIGNTARPPVRLCVQGGVLLKNDYGTYPDSSVYVNNRYYDGYTVNIGQNKPDAFEAIPLNMAATVGVNGFVDPHVIQPQDVQPDIGIYADNGVDPGLRWAPLPSVQGKTYMGYRLPDFTYDPARVYDPQHPASSATFDWSTIYFYINTDASSPYNNWLEYLTPSGLWVPYTYNAGISHLGNEWKKTPGFFTAHMGPATVTSKGVTTNYPAFPGPINETSPTPFPGDNQYFIQYPQANTDPRTLRFGYTSEETNSNNTATTWPYYLNTSLWSSGTETYTSNSLSYIGRPSYQNFPSTFYPTGYTYGSAASMAPVGTARNNANPGAANASLLAAYADPDGVQRLADSGLYTAMPSSSNGWAGDPYALSTDRKSDGLSMTDRPIILHRPFNNVAELGYVSRDCPWRTLDFFTAKSPDAGLLDIFTASANTEALSAGRINLNTRNLPALYAVLSGSVPNILTNTATPAANALSVATKLAAFTASTDAGKGLFIGKDEIVTRFLPTLSGTDFATTDDASIKTRRETVTRSLAEVGQTRTWNLLVDVIAQTGHYTPNANKLAQFNVEGERHYWLHVAIDRFTGTVVDMQLEAVTE